jgi:hypothetical protein
MDALHYIRGVAPMVALPYEGLILAVLKGRHQSSLRATANVAKTSHGRPVREVSALRKEADAT